MSKLLDRKEYVKAMTEGGLPEVCAVYDDDTIATLKAQARKIALELQIIHSIPDPKICDRKMGEFIKKLMEEVQCYIR